MERDPWDDFRRMQEELNRLFSGMFGAAFSNLAGMAEGVQDIRTPAADVWETDDHVVVQMEIPGASKDDIEIDAVPGGLEVKVEEKNESEEEDEGYRSYSRRYSGYYRKVSLPQYAEADKAEASYENGILEIKVPKKEGGKKKRINVD